MIPSGLKVGDTFTEDEKTYKVLEIVEEGYISTMIETPVVVEAEVAEEKPATRGRKKKA